MTEAGALSSDSDPTRIGARRRVAPRLALMAAACALLSGPAIAQTETTQALTLPGGPVETDADGRGAIGIGEENGEERATLEADQITYNTETEVVDANGNVEVFYGDRVLRADRIVYDARTDEIQATGSVRLINPDGTVLTADEAAIDSELRNGLVQGARAVLSDGRSRFAAVEGRRIDGSFTTMSKVVYSPCRLCAESETPLWRIRARRVIHDQEARDVIYDDAVFEVMGVPVGYLPSFRHADPTVVRRSGFLTPEFLSADGIGAGVKAPYFWEISPNRDLTVAPFLVTEERPLLELEYRANETYGKYRLFTSSTISSDKVERGFRGHLEGDGRFRFGSGVSAGYNALIATDDTYLRRFQYTDTDRAEVRLYGEQLTDDRFARLEGVRFQSFRSDEPAGEIPLVLPQAEIDQLFDAPWAGGALGLQGNFLYLRRTEGVDVARANAQIGFQQNYVTDFGVVFDGEASVRGDIYRITDDPDRGDSTETRGLPLASVAASFPLGRSTSSASHVIEPLVRVTYAPTGLNPAGIPNEDSQDLELDEINIFSVNRSTGLDLFEEGPRATVGMRYQRISASDGPNVEAVFGQSFRLEQISTFNEEAGLNNTISDFVGAWSVDTGPRFNIGHRFRVSEEFSLERNEVFGAWRPVDRLLLSGSYVQLDGDPEINSSEDRAEVKGDVTLDLGGSWAFMGGVRRDLELDRFVSTNGTLRWGGGCADCVEVDFRVGRRFNDVEDAPASTDFGVSVRLKTLGGP